MTEVSARTVSSSGCRESMGTSGWARSGRGRTFPAGFGSGRAALDPRFRAPGGREVLFGRLKRDRNPADGFDMADSHDRIRRPSPDSQTLPRVDAFVPTVLAWRALNEWDEVKGQVVRSDARVAELMLGLVRDTADARYDEHKLLGVVADYALRAFPNATNFVLVSRDELTDDLVVRRAQTHEGRSTEAVQLSRTIAE